MTSPVTLDYIKQHLNIPTASTENDAELQGVLDAAVDLAETIIGPINTRTLTEVHMDDGTGSVALNASPVIAVQSVTTNTGINFGSTPTPGGFYYLLSTSGVLRLFSAYGLGYVPQFSQIEYTTAWQTITVAYTAGRPSLSPRLQLAVGELVRHLWQTQQGSRMNANAEEWSPQMAYAIPNRVRELFGKDRRPGIG